MVVGDEDLEIGLVNFRTGNPDPDSFPSRDLATVASSVLERDGSSFARYPGQDGSVELRQVAAHRFERNNQIQVPLEKIGLTSGSMQAISLLTHAFVQPGDAVITEEYSYSGSLACFRKFGADIVGVPVDERGMSAEGLEETLIRLNRSGRRPKFLYTIATNQNPSGTTMPVERREQILALAQAHGVLVIDDDCYADLLFEQSAPISFRAMDPNSVIYLGSFSKILGPGFRLGYLIAEEETLEEVQYWKIDGGTSSLTSTIAARYLHENMWDHIDAIKAVVSEKRDAVVNELDSHPDAFVSHSDPKGGLFVWVRLPENIDTRALLAMSLQRGVDYGEGRRFHYGDEDIPYLRIAFGYPSLDQIRYGVPRLADCVRELLKSERTVSSRKRDASRSKSSR